MFVKRPRRHTSLTAVIRTWRSLDGRYAVEEITSLFGLPRYYLAVERLRNGNAQIVSRHRKRTAAYNALSRLIEE